MVRLAILDPVLPHQITERPDELEGIDVVWKGASVDDLESVLPRVKPTVLVVDLDSLGNDPVGRLRKLQAKSNAELVITLYRFARRDLVDELGRDGRKAVKSPISLGGLRMQMLGVLVRSILSPEDKPMTAAASPPGIPARTFTTAQLGRLAEIESAVQCECPNHLSSLLLSLMSFEDYSEGCENKNDADAAVHRALHEHTAQARAMMERALELLVRHEKIVL